MNDILKLNVQLLRRRVPNLTKAAKSVGLRPATVSNLCTGKTSVGKAEVKTIIALAKLAECSLDELIIQHEEITLIETGIKVIDLFAPLVQGGVVGIVGRTGSGQISFAAELCHRLRLKKFKIVFWKPEIDDERLSCLTEQADTICSTFSEVYDFISLNRTVEEVLLVADKSVVVSGELYEFNKLMGDQSPINITTVLVDIKCEAIDEEVPFGPLDTLLKFDVVLSKRGLFPSIDAVYSVSTLLEEDIVKEKHLIIQKKARRILRRYKELSILMNIQVGYSLTEVDKEIFRRGERIEAFLSQPQFVVEHITGKNGEWVSLNDTLDDIKTIIDGSYDSVAVSKLQYIGQLSEHLKEEEK